MENRLMRILNKKLITKNNKMNTIKTQQMKNVLGNIILFLGLSSLIFLNSCSTMNKTQKGAVIGTTGGAAAGAIIGRIQARRGPSRVLSGGAAGRATAGQDPRRQRVEELRADRAIAAK